MKATPDKHIWVHSCGTHRNQNVCRGEGLFIHTQQYPLPCLGISQIGVVQMVLERGKKWDFLRQDLRVKHQYGTPQS